MEILFKNAKLRKLCNSDKMLVRTWGPENGKRARSRLDEMRDVECLAHLMLLPQARCHKLTNRGHQFSLDLKHPYRLIFEVANEPLPLLPDGGLDLERVTVVRVLDREDTHG